MIQTGRKSSTKTSGARLNRHVQKASAKSGDTGLQCNVTTTRAQIDIVVRYRVATDASVITSGDSCGYVVRKVPALYSSKLSLYG